MGFWVSLFNYLFNYRGDLMILLLVYGISNQSVEKILINRACYSDNAIQQIKDLISKYGRKIELYDLDGNLL